MSAPAPLLLRSHVTALPGGMDVHRLLPAAQRRAVGPFVFFDHFGPITLPAALDSDIGGHPHIGLSTVTYLFDGALLHRDSLGSTQRIEPGAINWMTAGHGIVHSERTPDDLRGRDRPLHGLQLWVALPPDLQACDPAFQHVPAGQLPRLALPGGVHGRLMVGEAFGVRSPVRTAWPTLYLDLQLPADARLDLPALAPELALYRVDGSASADGTDLAPHQLLVLPDGLGAMLQAGAAGARLVVLGGAPLPQVPRMWWNFVASDRALLAAATRRWADGGFPTIPGEAARIAAPPWRD